MHGTRVDQMAVQYEDELHTSLPVNSQSKGNTVITVNLYLEGSGQDNVR